MTNISGSPSREPSGANMGTLAGMSPTKVRGWVRNMILYEDSENTEFDDTVQFRFRPQPVNESVSAVYESTRVMGMSHQYKSYSHTENFAFNFSIYSNTLMMLKEMTQQRPRAAYEGSDLDLELLGQEIEKDRRFLEACMLPYRSPIGIIGSSPPPLILCIPGIVTMRCRLLSLNLSFVDCDIKGNLKAFQGQVSFEEAPLGRITMRDHLMTGCFRTWGQ